MSPSLAVYVHFPWCVRKCPYCDFNSHAAPVVLPEEAYVESLCRDLDADLPLVGDRAVASVFLGGGTPSLFSPAAIGRFLARLRESTRLEPDAEITLEANPGTIERGRFEGYAEAGVNRVSIGAQTFSAAGLATLGRIHSPGDIEAAVADLRRAGIGNFNLDLMYGLPDQTLEEALADVRTALDLGPPHLSHYQLTLEPGTPFFRRPPRMPGDDRALDMQLACQELISSAGLAQYEVSAYARPGHRCRHNLAYWTFGDYLGLGAGAHGKMTTAEGILRTERIRRPRQYLSTGSEAATRWVTAEELPFEFALNTFRLSEGFALADFEKATGLPPERLAPALAKLSRRGLVELAAGRVRATALGFRFLNDVQAAFLPDPAPDAGRAA
jgi:oxygen-independent coproporphyrinogen-3 oxidase